jgi:hypothetical protein
MHSLAGEKSASTTRLWRRFASARIRSAASTLLKPKCVLPRTGATALVYAIAPLPGTSSVAAVPIEALADRVEVDTGTFSRLRDGAVVDHTGQEPAQIQPVLAARPGRERASIVAAGPDAERPQAFAGERNTAQGDALGPG